MFFYTIKSSLADDAIYCGNFPNFRSCIEQAVADGVSLRGASLRHVNLCNAELDGADLRDADFTGSNLTGINLSECRLNRANFTDCALYAATLCESVLDDAVFDSTRFGATDIYDASLKNSVFNTLSAFTLQFGEASCIAGVRFLNPCDMVCPMSRPPLVVQGLRQMVVLMDRHIKIGHDVFDIDEFTSQSGSGLIHPTSLRLRLEQLVTFKGMQCITDAPQTGA